MSQIPGLEFDARQSGIVSDDGLHAVSPMSRGLDEKKTQYMDSANIFPQGQPQERRIFGFRRAVFWLSIATALALALAIVAAAVGGSLAVKRAHNLDQLQQAQAYDYTLLHMRKKKSLLIGLIENWHLALLSRKTIPPCLNLRPSARPAVRTQVH
jgi:hypothetical protein